MTTAQDLVPLPAENVGMARDYPIQTTVVIDGVEAYCLPEDLAAGRPTVLDGLTLQWGRDSLADQPEPGSCAFTVREQVADGESSILEAARVGASVEVWARTDDGATADDTQQWEIANQPSTPEQVTATNLLTDPGFEYGVGGFTGSSTLPDTEHVHSGASAVKITPSASSNSYDSRRAFTAQAGKTYTFSIWQWVPAGTTRVRNLAMGQGVAAAVTYNTDPVTFGDWQFVQVSNTAPSDGTMYVHLYGGDVAGQPVWYDDGGLTEGTQPVDFNGDTPASGSTRYRWTGTPGASTSEQYTPAANILASQLWVDTRAGTPMAATMSTGQFARCRPSPTVANWAGGIVFPPDRFSNTTGAWDHIQRIMPGQQWQVTIDARMPIGGAGGILYVLLTNNPARTAPAAVAPINADYIPSDGDFHTVTGTITLPEHWDDPDGAWVLPGAFAINAPAGSYIDIRRVSTTPTAETTREVLVWAGEIATVTLTPAGDHAVQAQISAIDIAASLANITIGDEPWPVQTIAERATRIVDLAQIASHKQFELLVDDHLDSVRVQRRDVDAQPAEGLLHDLATSGSATLWPAASAARGGYLWMEDPQSRRSMRILTVATDGTGDIVDAPPGPVANVTANDVLRDPVSWIQDPSSISSSIDVTWIEAFGRDPETGELITVEKTVTRTDYDLVDQFGLRKYAVQTELAYVADAVALCARLMWQAGGSVWRFTGLAIDTSVLQRAPIDGGPTQTERLTTVMDLLDGRRRIGKAIEISDMPVWTPGGTPTGLFIEGGTYTVEEHQWQLELQATPAEGQGHSVTWDEVPTELSWDDMTDIAWDDLQGVGT